MKQNIYDNEIFYKSYLDLRKNSIGLNDVLEIPAFRALLPKELAYAKILDLGCGFGESSKWYVEQGADTVIGVDISEKMIAKANELFSHNKIEYLCLPIEDINFSKGQFDFVLSSLAFHYIADLKEVFEKIHMCLKTDGFLIFSQEHPIATARKLANGWFIDKNGEKGHWIVDNYQDEGSRKQNWLVDGVIKYHRTVATIINTLVETGFRIVRVEEPIAIAEAERDNAALKNERRRPPFLIMKAQKIGR